MGIYIFKKAFLLETLAIDHVNSRSRHDFGKDIIPKAIRKAKVIAYDHETNVIAGEHAQSTKKRQTYWKDVGTLDAYWETNMDLVDFDPELDLYNPQWPIMTVGDHQPMYKIVTTDDSLSICASPHYMAAGGTVTTNAERLSRVVIGRRVILGKDICVKDTVLLDDVVIGANARITRAILDEGVKIPAGCVIGESLDDDRARNIRITDKGIRLVTAQSQL